MPKKKNKQLVDAYTNIPKKAGLLAVRAGIDDGSAVFVSIIGDSGGLRYLAKLLDYMADIDVEKQGMPIGERAHIPLHAGIQLVTGSCEVEICRAEARGTSALPDYFSDT